MPSKIIFDTHVLIECSKCNLFQAQGTAKECTVAVLTVESGDGNNTLELRAYDQVLGSIAGTSADVVPAKSLLKALRFDLIYLTFILSPAVSTVNDSLSCNIQFILLISFHIYISFLHNNNGCCIVYIKLLHCVFNYTG